MRENCSQKTRRSGHLTAFALILLVALLSGSTWGQREPSQPATPPTLQSAAQPASSQTTQPPGTASTTDVPGAGVTVQERQQGTAPPQSPQQPQPETRITKAQAKELFRSVDVILNFASRNTGLPIQSQ